MSLNPDKNGNIEGFIKKEVHEKMKRNYMDTIENLQYKVDDLRDKMKNLQENHEVFKRDYKEKYNDFEKLTLKYEKCNTKGLIDELEEYKSRYRAYFNKYGNLE